MRLIEQKNLDRVIEYIGASGIDFVLINDSEGSRSSNLMYCTGHPMDGMLLIGKSGRTYLRVWDIILGKKIAEADMIVSMEEYTMKGFFDKVCQEENLTAAPVVEISGRLAFGFKNRLDTAFGLKTVFKETGSAFELLDDIRNIKGPKEIDIIRKGMAVTNELIEKIPGFINNSKEVTESDLAFYLMAEAKKLGAQKESFEYLVANKSRSWGIHAYPASSGQPLNLRGLALIDFGILYEGYCTDVTIPMGFGGLTDTERKIVDTVKKAHDAAISAISPGVENHVVSHTAVAIIENEGYKMPHGLGHGVGLDVHEAPSISEKPKDPIDLKNWKPQVLKEGMLFTIEPGIYDEKIGGCRLEDDVLVTKNGVEVLTRSRFFQFDRSV